jgi:hypothetical protein
MGLVSDISAFYFGADFPLNIGLYVLELFVFYTS